MRPDDLRLAAVIARKYASAVETKLYWEMSTSAAKFEIAEANRVAGLLEVEAERRDEEK